MDTVNPQYPAAPQGHLLPRHDDLLPAAIPVEYLARTILQREKLSPGELCRCRGEVLLQLACSPPQSEANESDALDRSSDSMILEYMARPVGPSSD